MCITSNQTTIFFFDRMQFEGFQMRGHSTTELIAAQDFVTLTLGYGFNSVKFCAMF